MKITYTDMYNVVIHEEWNVNVVPRVGDLVSLVDIFVIDQAIWHPKENCVQLRLNMWNGMSSMTESVQHADASKDIKQVKRQLSELDKRQTTNEKNLRTLKDSVGSMRNHIKVDSHNNKDK